MTDNEQGYTPTTEEVLDYVLIAGTDRHPHISDEETRAAFHRWLYQRDAATLAAHRVTLEAESREALAEVIFNHNSEAMGSSIRYPAATDRMRRVSNEYADALLASGVVSVTEPVQYEAVAHASNMERIADCIKHQTWGSQAENEANAREAARYLAALTSRPAPVAPPTEEEHKHEWRAIGIERYECIGCGAKGTDVRGNSDNGYIVIDQKPVVPVDALGFPTQEGATFTAQFQSGATGGRFIVLANRHVRLPGVGTFTIGGIDHTSIEDVRPADGRNGQ